MICAVCGEPGCTTPWGPAGSGGVCRYPDDPNQDDQGQHVMFPRPLNVPEHLQINDINDYLRQKGER